MHASIISNFLSIIFIFVVSVSSVYIENNGYRDITIAFSSSLKQTDIPFGNLKKMIQKSSELLFRATGRRAYLSSVILSLPSTWTNICEKYDTINKSPRDLSVYVTDSGNERNEDIRAQHSKGCGKKGEIIYLPKDLLKGDLEELSREFVQQWAIYRYGIFEERTDDEQSCFTKDGLTWIPNACYNIDISIPNVTLDENGLPFCDSVSDVSSYKNLRSSFMSTTTSRTVLDFCNGSTSLPHNPLIPTRQNILCGGRSVWSVIKDTDDFRYGSLYTPIGDSAFEPSVSFRCHEQTRDHFIFAVQTRSIQNIEWIMVEIRTSLLRFFIYDIPRDAVVSLIAYHEETEGPFKINTSNASSVSETVKNKIRTANVSNSVDLLGGLHMALNVSQVHENLNNIIILIALASAFKSQNLFDFVKEIETSSEVCHFIVIQDTMDNVLPSNLIHAIKMTGGQIFMTPGIEVLLSSKLTMLLPTVMRSPFHLYEKSIVVYQKSHFNIIGKLIDEFTTDLHLKGEMVYTVICNSVERLIPTANCGRLPNMGEKIFCVNTTTLTSKKVETKWKFRFEDRRTMDQLNCSTIVTVRLDEDVRNLITLRGWLSDYRIYPRQNVLVIYAEVMQDGMPVTDAQVTADIYSSTDGPPISVELWDTGNGDPDSYKGDGIYSKYFTQIHEKGMHLVALRAARDPMKIINDENTMKSVTGFTRITVVGSFEVMEKPPNVDLYPPSRIGDLKVVSVNHTMPSATLQWTAPGGDYDHGTVNLYKAFYSAEWKDLMIHDSVISSEQLHPLQDNKFWESGKIQRSEYRLPQVNESTLYYVVLQATDQHFNYGALSNMVALYIHRNNSLPTVVTDDTLNATCTGSTESSTIQVNYKILIFVCTGVLLLLLMINLVLWIVCFHKQKRNKEANKTIKHHLKEISSIAERELRSINTLGRSSENIVDNEITTELEEYDFSTSRKVHDSLSYATRINQKECIVHENSYGKDQLYSSVNKKSTSEAGMSQEMHNVKEKNRKYSSERLKPTHENDIDMGFV